MRIAVIGALAILLATTCSVRADDIPTAYAAVGALFQKDGGGLVAREALCPQKNKEPWAYVTSATVASIDDKDSSVLVNALGCSGGNGHGQFLVLIQGGSAHVVTDVEIGDMSFIASVMNVEDNAIVLYGDRWLDNDAHCCPSKKATLEYNVKTGQHKLTIVGDNKQ